jgi:hypothetical protein
VPRIDLDAHQRSERLDLFALDFRRDVAIAGAAADAGTLASPSTV